MPRRDIDDAELERTVRRRVEAELARNKSQPRPAATWPPATTPSHHHFDPACQECRKALRRWAERPEPRKGKAR